MQIRTLGPKSPFQIASDDGSSLSTQPNFDCALAYVQGIFDQKSNKGIVGRTIEILFDRKLGHRADTFLAVHRGTAEYIIGKEIIFGAVQMLQHCLEKSVHKSFALTIRVSDSHYMFDRKNDVANGIYYEQRSR